ncbi:MAG: polyamine aminopropyltransferase [Cyclobacteriaceae bacterium]
MKLKSQILKIALFATGLSGIVAEYVLSTLATYFLGNSVFQFTMIVSIMLFSMGLGSRFSKYFKNHLLEKFILIEFILSLLVAFVSVITYLSAAIIGVEAVVIYSLSITIGLMIGMEIPLVIRINDEYQTLRLNISSAMENDYYGSLLGGVFFAFIGLPYLGLSYTPFVLGSVNLVVAISLFILLKKEVSDQRKGKLVILAFVATGGILFGSLLSKKAIEFGEKERYSDRVIYTEQTPYQRITITQSKGDFWLFINGNQQLSTIDEVMYHEPLVHPLLSLLKNPTSVLVLGGGDGGAVREILKYPTVRDITLVDLDPAMTDLGKNYPLLVEMNNNSMNHEKVEIINTDGYNYLEDTKTYYDAIIIDLPDPKSVELGRLYSYEFYKLCYRQLRPNGLIITQAGSPYYAARAFNCIDRTMSASGFTTLPLHNQVITLGEWGWIMGAKNIDKQQLKSMVQNVNLDSVPTRWMNNESLTLITSFGKNAFPNQQDSVEVNKIHNPVLYKYYLNGNWDIY